MFHYSRKVYTLYFWDLRMKIKMFSSQKLALNSFSNQKQVNVLGFEAPKRKLRSLNGFSLGSGTIEVRTWNVGPSEKSSFSQRIHLLLLLTYPNYGTNCQVDRFYEVLKVNVTWASDNYFSASCSQQLVFLLSFSIAAQPVVTSSFVSVRFLRYPRK